MTQYTADHQLFRCKICPDDEELMLSEERISRHLSRHSSFFSRSVPSYSEAVCRVCQAVLEDSEARTVVQHYEKLHPAASFASAEVQSEAGSHRRAGSESETPSETSLVTRPPLEMTEAELMNINWQQGRNLLDALKALAKFLMAIEVVEVVEQEEGSDNVLFRIAEKKKFIKTLKIYSKNETNSFDKLRSTSARLAISGSRRNGSMFGLLVNRRRDREERHPLQRLLTKYPGAQVEEGSQAVSKSSLAIVWFKSKLEFFRVLTDSSLQLSFTPTMENFVDLKTPSEDKKVQKKKVVRQEPESDPAKRRKLR